MELELPLCVDLGNGCLNCDEDELAVVEGVAVLFGAEVLVVVAVDGLDLLVDIEDDEDVDDELPVVPKSVASF